MGRVLMGGLVAGVMVFMWGFISHTALPIGTAGIRVLPDEAAVMEVLEKTVQEPGIYLFPGLDPTAELSEEDQQAWARRYQAGPTGFLAFQPAGRNPFAPDAMLIELVTSMLAGVIAAWILYHVTAGPFMRIQLAMLMGVFGWLAISASHWNWYRFPTEFFVAEGVDQAVGWLLAGLALARIVRPRVQAPGEAAGGGAASGPAGGP